MSAADTDKEPAMTYTTALTAQIDAAAASFEVSETTAVMVNDRGEVRLGNPCNLVEYFTIQDLRDLLDTEYVEIVPVVTAAGSTLGIDQTWFVVANATAGMVVNEAASELAGELVWSTALIVPAAALPWA